MRRLWLCTATVAVASSAQQCLSDADLARIAAAGQSALELGGAQPYNVTTEGSLGAFDFSFAPANYTHSGVNPSSRYVVPRLGPWREGDLGGDSFLNWGIGEVTTLTSRMALVVVMCTPPPTLLWSLEAAVLYRLKLLAGSHQPGASISNTENSATVAPAARADAPLLVIMTADAATEAAVRSAFAPLARISSSSSSSSSSNSLNVATIVINGTSSLLNFGVDPLGDGCDIFQLCMRVHASAAQTAAADFQSYLGRRFPLLVVEPTFAGADAPLYPVADRPMRQGETTEAGLEARRGVLADAVARRMMQGVVAPAHRLVATVPFAPVELDKRRCLLDGKYHPYGTGNCYGTSSDGRYTLSQPYTLPAGDVSSLVTVVVGANHVATGNAADAQLLYGKAVTVNPGGLAGSAEFYLGDAALPADAGLFAFAFAENCTGLATAFCTAVEPQQGGAAGQLLRFEAYLDNESGTRPSMGLVHPVALVFAPAA